VAEYEAYATSLAFLRHRGLLGRAGADFAVRERELLGELWRRREIARPALAYAAHVTTPIPVPPPWPALMYGYGAPQPYAYPQAPAQAQPYGPPTPYPAYDPYRS
jgi:hypothetical protein